MSTESHDMFGLPDDDEMRAKILAQDVEELKEQKWPKRLVEYVQVLESLFTRLKMPKDKAFFLACQAVRELAKYRGGKVDYFPFGEALETFLLHMEIHRKCKGNNHEALAEEYGMSMIHIYKIDRQQRALHISKRQGKLVFNQQG